MRFNHRVGARELRWNFKAQRLAGHEQRRDELRRRVATAEALPRAGVNCEQAAIGLAAKFLRYFGGGVRGDDVNAKKKNPEQHARGSWK